MMSIGTMEILTGALVLITGIYAFLTWKIAKSNDEMVTQIKKQYEESLRPTILAYLTFRSSTVVRLTLKNFGQSPAYDVEITIDKDFYQFAGERNVKNFGIFNSPITIFPPAYEIKIDLAQGFNFDVFKDEINLTPSSFDVAVKYKSKLATYEDTFRIDLGTFFELHIEATSEERLEKIGKHLEKIANR